MRSKWIPLLWYSSAKLARPYLAQLFDQPEATTYLRELSRQTGIGPGPLQHELNQLQKADLVVRQQDGNRVAIPPMSAHPIFAEFSPSFARPSGFLHRSRPH